MSQSAQNSPSTLTDGARPFFAPKPYLFSKQDRNQQIIDISPDECKRENVQCPAFNVLLDHTIAVLWICYSAMPPGATAEPVTGPDRVRLLTTGQLEWAVQFLKSTRNGDGEHSLDVRTAIEHLQDVVFNKYAEAPVPNRTASAKMLMGRAQIAGASGGGPLKACQSLPSVVDSSATDTVSESTVSLMESSTMSATLDVFLGRCIPERLGHLLGRGKPATMS